MYLLLKKLVLLNFFYFRIVEINKVGMVQMSLFIYVIFQYSVMVTFGVIKP